MYLVYIEARANLADTIEIGWFYLNCDGYE